MIALQDLTLPAQLGGPALRAIDCVFPDGRISSVVGAAASGKTLLLTAILGHHRPLNGSIRVNGLDPAVHSQTIRRQSCYIACRFPLLPHLTILEHVRYLIAMGGGPLGLLERQIVSALRLSELPDRLIRRRVSSLTALERFSVWLAVHRLRETRILFVDDPAADLPTSEGTEVARLLREAVSDRDVAVVTSRDADFAGSVADHGYRIESGMLVPQPSRPGAHVAPTRLSL